MGVEEDFNAGVLLLIVGTLWAILLLGPNVIPGVSWVTSSYQISGGFSGWVYSLLISIALIISGLYMGGRSLL